MGSVDAAADEVLFYSVAAYGKKIRDLSIVPCGEEVHRTFHDYTLKFPDKCRFINAISSQIVSKKIDKRSAFPEGVNFDKAIDQVYELRNAIFHGRHIGLDKVGKHIFQRAIIVGKENKKRKFDHLDYHVSPAEIEACSNFLRMANNFFCACAEAARADGSVEVEVSIHGSLFWETFNSFWNTQSFDGKGTSKE